MKKRLVLIVGGLCFSLVLLINACGFGLIAIICVMASDHPRLELYEKAQAKYKAEKTPCKKVVFCRVDIPECATCKAADLCECLVPVDMCSLDACQSIKDVSGRRAKYGMHAGDSIAAHEIINEQKIFICQKKLHKGDRIKKADVRLLTIPFDSADSKQPLDNCHADCDVAAGQVIKRTDILENRDDYVWKQLGEVARVSSIQFINAVTEQPSD